ncbi:TPA: hypothetical protein EYP13_02690 [Candidatus Micrarchaeota archaeon]|nr:hypothetical protein [Candidatus Micrarchaeota archaeon]
MEATAPSRRPPAAVLFFVLGVLVGGGVMYHIGYLHGAQDSALGVRQCVERVELLSNALERATGSITRLEVENERLRAQVRDLGSVLSEVLDSLSGRSVTGELDGVRISVPAAVTARGREFCVEVLVQNSSDLQKILKIELSGTGIVSEPSAQSVGPGTTVKLPVCGEVEKSATRASVRVNGMDVVSFYVLVTGGG